MAHLPETLDEPLASQRRRAAARSTAPRTSYAEARDADRDEDEADDPVVRMPKRMAAAPPAPGVEPAIAHMVIALALALGGALGGAGVLMVYAVHKPQPVAVAARASTPGASRASSAALSGGANASAAGRAPAGASANARENARDRDTETTEHRVGRGRTLVAALRAAGLTPLLASRVVASLRPLVNLRALRPEDVLRVSVSREGERPVRRVELQRGESDLYGVTVGEGDRTEASRLDLVRTVALVPAGFRVAGALDLTLRAAGVRPEAASRVREVLDAMDLPRVLADGDVLRLVLTEERLNGAFLRYGPVEAADYEGSLGHRRAYRLAIGARADWYDASGHTPERGPLFAPVRPARVTAPFDPRRTHPVLHRLMPHLGTDFAAAEGDPVYAAADGVVLSVGSVGPAGTLVRIAHASLGVETGYAHLSRVAEGVQPGAPVAARALIAYAGSTGRSSGPHLHFSMKQRGRFVDPMRAYRGRSSVPDSAQADFASRVQRADAALDAVLVDGRSTRAPERRDEPAPAPASPRGAPALDETFGPGT